MAGITRAVLTGRNSAIVQRRCSELRFDSIKLGRFDKPMYEELADRLASVVAWGQTPLYLALTRAEAAFAQDEGIEMREVTDQQDRVSGLLVHPSFHQPSLFFGHQLLEHLEDAALQRRAYEPIQRGCTALVVEPVPVLQDPRSWSIVPYIALLPPCLGGSCYRVDLPDR